MGDIYMNIDKRVLDLLLRNAKKAFNKEEIPVSAVVLDENGNVVSSSYNNRQSYCNVLGHAEVLAILKAEKKLKDWRLDGYSMIVSLEPCDMCSMIIKESRLDKVYYFLPKKNDKSNINIDVNKLIIEDYPEYTEKFKDLLTSFFDNKR